MTPHSESKSTLKSDLILLLFATAVTCFLFRDSSIDLWAAKKFFHPENVINPWFEEHFSLWSFFYFAAPWLSGLLLLGSLGVLIGSQFKDSLKPQRKYAAFAFLVVVCGSGFFINTVFKPYWGRPRPREILELGGNKPYQAFYQPNIAGPGKSFPCGHCSVGFSYGLLAWILRRRKPKLAACVFGASLFFGLLMGAGRMAAGGHFLSDVFFAGLIIYWSCFAVYHLILKIPRLERLAERDPSKEGIVFGNSMSVQNKPLQAMAFSALGLATVAVLLIATPYHYEYALTGFLIETPSSTIENLNIQIDAGQVEVKVSDDIKTTFRIDGVAQGFGFPGGKLVPECKFSKDVNICEIKKVGLFSDLENKVVILVRTEFIRGLTVKINEGDFVHREAQDSNQESKPLPANYIFIENGNKPQTRPSN